MIVIVPYQPSPWLSFFRKKAERRLKSIKNNNIKLQIIETGEFHLIDLQ